jgi:hypothetical protein
MTARGGGGLPNFLLLIFVLVGWKKADMSNFSFLGNFSGTSPGQAAGRMLDFSKLRLTQPSLAGSGAELGHTQNHIVWKKARPLKMMSLRRTIKH